MIWVCIYDILCLMALLTGGFVVSLCITLFVGYVLSRITTSELAISISAILFWFNMLLIIVVVIILLVIDVSNWRMML